MKHIIAAALLSLPVASLAQDELTQNGEAYFDCLSEWGTRSNMDRRQLGIVELACAFKYLGEDVAMETIDYLYDPCRTPKKDRADLEDTELCDPVFGGGDCSGQ